MAVSWPTVVPDASSIVWTSFLRVWMAVLSAVLVEWLGPTQCVGATGLGGVVLPRLPRGAGVDKLLVAPLK